MSEGRKIKQRFVDRMKKEGWLNISNTDDQCVWFPGKKKIVPWFRESHEILDGFISTDSYLIQPC